jgi:hypothetical protein
MNVGQDLAGQPPGPQAVHQRLAHRPASRLDHQVGHHAVAGVVVDPGDQLALGASASHTPPMTSICHSDIGASRPHGR